LNKSSFHSRSLSRAALPLFAFLCCLQALLVALPADAARTQKKPDASARPVPTPSAPLLTRTSTLRETRRLGFGGMVTIYGAPEGSITIEGWPQSQFDVTAETELRAPTDQDLTRLAAVNRFLLDDDLNHIRLVTTGTHDRKFMKRAAKNFPKPLLSMPWKIDYRLRVPAATDLEIYAGRGALRLAGVEGALRLNAGDSDATFALSGGDVEATIQRGSVLFRLPSRNWRGRGANIRLGTGDLTVELPANYNGDLNVEVLRNGRIENSYPALTPRERTDPSERSLQARAGSGGTMLSFTVGDGTLRIRQAP
jgi:hypothetical protein